WMGIGVMLSTFAVPIIAGLYWRGATTKGALAAMATGLIGSGVFGYYYQYIDTLPVHFSLYSLTLALIVMIAVSLVTAKNSQKALDETMTGWYIFRRR
ncbi:MAG: sodium:solute symporter family protein, partial [Methanocalculus sp. MSAO_Arc2]